MKDFFASQGGFTLAEVALALAIVSLVIGALVPTLLSLRAGQQMTATRNNLETVMRAVSAYSARTGCLPCPADPTKVNRADEGRVRTGTACGACADPVGLVPFISLGLPKSLAMDGFGNWLTYAVDTELTTDFGVIPPNKPCTEVNSVCTADDVASAARKQGLCRGDFTLANSLVMKLGPADQKAAMLVLSHGQNRRGAYRATPTDNNLRLAFLPDSEKVCPANGEAEYCNTDGDRVFYVGNVTQMDDVFLYLGRDALLSYLGNLACSTTWGGS